MEGWTIAIERVRAATTGAVETVGDASERHAARPAATSAAIVALALRDTRGAVMDVAVPSYDDATDRAARIAGPLEIMVLSKS
jgi:hypothetical protein